MPLDPFTLAAIAGGIKTLGGAAQTAFSGQRKAEKELTRQIEAIPEYVKSPSILEYYEQARQRYGVSPTQTAMYKRQMQNIGRMQATGLGTLQRIGSRGVLGGTSTLLRTGADAALGAEAAAENLKERRFGQLGAAAQMMRGEDVMQQQREMMRREQLIRQAAAKAAGRAAVQRAGLTNIFGGLTDIAKAGSDKSSSDLADALKALSKK